MIAQVGQVIAKRRRARGLEIQALAEGAAVSAEHASQLEAGQPGATTVELERLAAFLELDYGALVRGVEVDRVEPSVFLRHHAISDFNAVDVPVLDAALAQGRALRALCRLLGRPIGPGEAISRSPAGTMPARQGYSLARELRAALDLGGDPIADARALAEERLEVAVLVRPLSSAHVTALSMRAGDASVIVLNDLDPDRQKNPMLARVHVAHELCHLLHDPSAGGLHLVVDVAVDRREHAAEQRARGFAAELLLPLDGLKARFGNPRATPSLEEGQRLVHNARLVFGTPNEIAANHLTNLGFIDGKLREALLERATVVSGPETTLPGARAPSLAVRSLVEEAHRASLVTDGQARAALGIELGERLPWDAEGA